jgi:hypothetical protein
VESGHAAWGVTRQIAALALRQIRRTDVATAFSHGLHGAVALLLVDADAHVLPEIPDRAGHAAVPGRPRFIYGRQVVSVSGSGSSYPVTVPSGPELLRQAKDLMRRAQEDRGLLSLMRHTVTLSCGQFELCVRTCVACDPAEVSSETRERGVMAISGDARRTMQRP